MSENILAFEDVAALALRLSPLDKIRLIERIAPALERELAEPDDDQLSIAALNSPAATAVWDNPADDAAYNAIPWEPGDVSAR